MPSERGLVLIVDDEPRNRKLLGALVEQAGYRPIAASDGEHALSLALSEPVDAILLDILMPGIDGLEVARRLKEEPRTTGIPVLMVTALQQSQSRLAALDAGVEDYLIKPIDRAELAARLRNLVRLKRATEEIARHNERLSEEVERRTRELCTSERRFRRVLEGAALAAMMLDPEGRVTFCNDHLLGLLQRGRDEMIGKSWLDVAIPPIDRPWLEPILLGLMSGRRPPQAHEGVILASDGSRVWIEWNSTRMDHPDGGLAGLTCLGRDITAERRALEDMRLADAAIESSILPIAFTTLDGRVSRVNAALLRAWGYDHADEVLGRSMVDFWTAPVQAQAALEALTTDGGWTGVLTTVRRRTGEHRRMRLTAALVTGADGSPLRIMATFEDITQLEVLHDRLVEAQRIAGIGNWEWDIRTNILWWSDEVYRLFGLTPRERVPDYPWFLSRIPPDDRAEVEGAVASALEGGAPYALAHRISRPDGTTRTLQEQAEVLRDSGGQPIRMVGTVQDITERRAAEITLRRLSDLMQAVMDSAPVVVFSISKEGRLELVEGRSLPELGVHPSQCLGRTLAEAGALLPELASAFQRTSRGETVRGRLCVGANEFETLYAPRYDARGRIDGALGIALDVTARRRLEAQIQRAQKMEAIGLLAGGIAHDFNNLLTVVIASASMLKMALPPPSQEADDAQQVLDAAHRAAALTRQLLAFGRRQVLHPDRVDMNDTLRSLDKLLRRLIGADIVVRLDLDADVPATLADPTQIEQVVVNLVVNARDAMPQGGTLTLSTTVRRVTEDDLVSGGDYVEFAVSDSGTGMSPDTLARVFEPFFSTKPQGRGTGLGLAMLYGIVAQSGGTVRVESELGQGSTFRVLLPVAPAAAEDQPRSDPATDPVARRVTHGRVLVIEDEPQVRAIAKRCLEKAGFVVVTAADGSEGIDEMRRSTVPFVLVLTDVVMPRLSGADFARRAREELGATAPILFMSGYTEDTTLRYGVETAGVSLLQKPFTPDELMSKVREVLSLRSDSYRGL